MMALMKVILGYLRLMKQYYYAYMNMKWHLTALHKIMRRRMSLDQICQEKHKN